MTTILYLKLKEGTLVRLGPTREGESATRMMRTVQGWITAGSTLSLANAHGALEEVNMRNVVAVEMVEEPTPPTGSRLVHNPPASH